MRLRQRVGAEIRISRALAIATGTAVLVALRAGEPLVESGAPW